MTEEAELALFLVVLLAIVAPTLSAAQTSVTRCGLFSVRPESEALIFDRAGNIQRKVGPGLQTCIPYFETYVIENTLFERR